MSRIILKQLSYLPPWGGRSATGRELSESGKLEMGSEAYEEGAGQRQTEDEGFVQ